MFVFPIDTTAEMDESIPLVSGQLVLYIVHVHAMYMHHFIPLRGSYMYIHYTCMYMHHFIPLRGSYMYIHYTCTCTCLAEV